MQQLLALLVRKSHFYGWQLLTVCVRPLSKSVEQASADGISLVLFAPPCFEKLYFVTYVYDWAVTFYPNSCIYQIAWLLTRTFAVPYIIGRDSDFALR